MTTKRKLSKVWIVALAIIAVAAITAISYVYWSSGVGGNNDSTTGTVVIGSGKTATTTVELGTIGSNASGNVLIPDGITPAAGEVTTVTLTIDVKWVADVDADNIVPGANGTLVATCTSIKNGSSTELLAETVNGGASLFLVSFDAASYPITAAATEGTATAATVTITVKLSEPDDVAQYNKIAGQTITFTFNFAVAPV